MKVAIIGAGSVGGTLGRRFAEERHEVMFGVREGSSKDGLTGPRMRAGSVADAAAWGEVVLFATPWSATPHAIKAAGNLAGKIVLDCTNPIRGDFSGIEFGLESSAGEQVAALAPGAKVVKIFNTVGFNIMEDADFEGTAATMLFCGDDAGAKAEAGKLAADIGFDPQDIGPLIQARYLEAFAWLWISMATKEGYGREMAFRLMKR